MLEKVLRRTSRARADSTWVECGFPSLDLTGRLSFQSAYSIHANKPPKNGGCLGERVLFQLVNSYLKEPLETARSLRNVPSRHLTSCQPYEEPAPAPQEPWAQDANHGNVFVVCTKLLLSLSHTMYIYILHTHIHAHVLLRLLQNIQYDTSANLATSATSRWQHWKSSGYPQLLRAGLPCHGRREVLRI